MHQTPQRPSRRPGNVDAATAGTPQPASRAARAEGLGCRLCTCQLGILSDLPAAVFLELASAFGTLLAGMAASHCETCGLGIWSPATRCDGCRAQTRLSNAFAQRLWPAAIWRAVGTALAAVLAMAGSTLGIRRWRWRSWAQPQPKPRPEPQSQPVPHLLGVGGAGAEPPCCGRAWNLRPPTLGLHQEDRVQWTAEVRGRRPLQTWRTTPWPTHGPTSPGPSEPVQPFRAEEAAPTQSGEATPGFTPWQDVRPPSVQPSLRCSWLFVPLLHAGAGYLSRAAEQAWQERPGLGCALRSLLLPCAVPPPATLLRLLRAAADCDDAEAGALAAGVDGLATASAQLLMAPDAFCSRPTEEVPSRPPRKR